MPRWEVTKDDERPARPDGTCFYCWEPIGGKHKEDCVIPCRPVEIEVRIRLVEEFPVSWSEGDIEFSKNESTWCASNIIDRLEEIVKTGKCLCDVTEVKYIKEAG